MKFSQSSNRFKILVEAAILPYAINKTKVSIPFQKLGSHDSCRIVNSALTKVICYTSRGADGPEKLAFASDKAKLSPKTFSKNYNLDDSGIPLPPFPSKTNHKLHNNQVTARLVKVITNLDLLKTSSPDCIPVLV